MDYISDSRETWQEPGHELQWSDSFYFSAGDAEGSCAFYSRIGRRPREGVIEGAFGFYFDGGFCMLWSREPVPASRDLATSIIRYTCLEPYSLWRLEVNGIARCFPSAEQLSGNPGNFVERRVRGSVLCRCISPASDFMGAASGMARSVASVHYEQPGWYTGRIEIEATAWTLTGGGTRDHSYGVRDWQAVPYWRWFGAVWDPQSAFGAAEVGLTGNAPGSGGWLLQGGRLVTVRQLNVASSLRGDPPVQDRFELELKSDSGVLATVVGEAVAVASLRQRRGSQLTYVNEAWTRYRMNERVTYAISEYLVQARGNRPAPS